MITLIRIIEYDAVQLSRGEIRRSTAYFNLATLVTVTVQNL